MPLRNLRSLLSVGLFLCASVASACTFTAFPTAATYGVSGSPFDSILTADQCWMFVSVTQPSGMVAIDVFTNTGSAMLFHHTAPLKAGYAGKMALGPAGNWLVLAGNTYVAKINVAALKVGGVSPTYWNDPVANPGVLYLAWHYASPSVVVVSEEGNSSIVLLDFVTWTFMQRIAVGIAPVGLAWNSDQSMLYVTSQRAPVSYGWSLQCVAEVPGDPNLYPLGLLQRVQVSTWAVVATAPAGCVPVRVAYNGAGGSLVVTQRGDDTVTSYHPLTLYPLGQTFTGPSPVGLAFSASGGVPWLTVANSDRFSVPPSPSAYVYGVVGSQLFYTRTVATGHFPREVVASPDGSIVMITNADSQTVQINKI